MITARQTPKARRKAERRLRRQAMMQAQMPIPGSISVPRATPHAPPRVREFSAMYLVALALAEFVTVLVDTRWGVIGHAIILALMILQAAVNAYTAARVSDDVRRVERRFANFLTALALVPLIRIVSLALPLGKFPELTWYGIIALPLVAATWSVMRACGYDRRAVGLWIDRRPVSLLITGAVGLSGIGLGYIEYQILQPDPLIDDLTPLRVLVASAILMIGTGLTEELIFRGVLQRTGSDLFGDVAGIVYSAACFAILHIGHRSLVDVGFVFVVALLFGVIVRQTRSLAGVTIAHGLTNICLFILFPNLL